MNVICASSVSLGKEAFESLGSLRVLPETMITREELGDARVLVTRSKTPLTPALLQGSSVQVAGTCTAGIDHADPEGLAACGVAFHSAPGCNANAVSEYIVAALLEAHRRVGFRFHGSTLGIVGHGNVGRRVAAKARALGMRVLLNDPPREKVEGHHAYCPLETLLEEADVLSLHVPLVESGPHPTRRLIGAAELSRLRPAAILLNACRGEVTDSSALLQARNTGSLAFLALDVWDPEPQLPGELLAVADLGTAHIAGHSVEGKVNGTRQIREAVCRHFHLLSDWDPRPLLPPPACPRFCWQQGDDLETGLQRLVSACYDICLDDRLLREPTDDRGQHFQQLRRNYRDRREWNATTVVDCPAEFDAVLQALGFQLPAG